MCGRIEYVVHSKTELEGHYGVRFVEGHTEQGIINARYNVPPTSITPLVMEEVPDQISVGYWGYRPSWALTHGKAKEVINARVETVFEKPYFKKAVLSARCLIPVTGFFEWKRVGTTKTPYRFHLNGEIFSLGGIYSIVENKVGELIPHYAILTTGPSEIMRDVHDRLPVIVSQKDESQWIKDSLDEHEIARFFAPNEEVGLKRDRISTLVNSPKNDSPEILTPVSG